MVMNLGFENVFEKIRGKQTNPPRLTMRCCMLGARGVGKTSVITSMYNKHKKAISDTDLFLFPDDQTETVLDNKNNDLGRMFRGLHREREVVRPDEAGGIAPDYTSSSFQFTYGLHAGKVNIDLEIIDYPGEYLRKEPETVAAFINQADAILIAIDTPCLMEENGRFHEGKNRPELITDFLKQNLDRDAEKLVLFVPLNCEKYYHQNRIEEVTDAVETAYTDLIADLRSRKNCSGQEELAK